MNNNLQTKDTYNLNPLTVETPDNGQIGGGSSISLTDNPGTSSNTAISQKGVTDNFIQKGDSISVNQLPDSSFDNDQFTVTDYGTADETWHIKTTYLTQFLNAYFSAKAGNHNGDDTYFFTAAGTFKQIGGGTTTPPADENYDFITWTVPSNIDTDNSGNITRNNPGYNFNAIAHSNKKLSTTSGTGVQASFKIPVYNGDGELYIGINNTGVPVTNPQTDLPVSFHILGGTGIRAHGYKIGYPFGNYQTIVDGQEARLDILADGSVEWYLNNTLVYSLPAATVDPLNSYVEACLYSTGSKVRFALEQLAVSTSY